MKLNSKYLYLSAGVCCVMIFLSWFFFGRGIETGVDSYTITTEAAADSVFSPNASKVYITGEVMYPGVYDISPDMRVVDLIEVAGGATDNADLTKVNLAARLRDEQKINVPPKEGLATAAEPALININSATLEQLMTLPGIGEVTAKAIITRRENKPFTSIEELTEIYNIGEKTLERIRGLITAQ